MFFLAPPGQGPMSLFSQDVSLKRHPILFCFFDNESAVGRHIPVALFATLDQYDSSESFVTDDCLTPA